MLYLIIAVYTIIISFTGIMVQRKGTNFKEYFFAGGSLSWKSFAFTLSATWFGASSILILSRETFSQGLSSIWIMMVPTLLTLFIFLIYSNRIRKTKTFSIPEILRNSYGRTFHFIASITIYFYLILLSSSQTIALGKVISEFTPLNYKISIILGLLFVFIYSFRGGLVSVIKTDVIQLIFIFVGLSIIIFSLFFSLSSKEVLNPFLGKDFFNPLKNIKTNILITISFTLAWFISPVVWQRIVSAKTDKDAKAGILASSFLLSLLFLLPTFIGILGRFILPNEPTGELLMFIINHQIGKIAKIIVFLSIVSAIISTLDSTLNTSALTLSLDLGKEILKGRNISGKMALLLSSFLTLLCSLPLSSILLALGLSSQVLVCSIFVPLIFSFIFKKASETAGILSLLSGFAYSFFSYIKMGIGVSLPIPSWPISILLGLLISFLFFVLGLLFKKEAKILH